MSGWGRVRRLLGLGDREHPGAAGTLAPGGLALDLADIQGFVLRAYMMPVARHFLLTVGAPEQARRQLGRLVSGDESDTPQITTAEDWHVGFAPGPVRRPQPMPRVASPTTASTSASHGPDLCALGLERRIPKLSFGSFGAFIEGAAQRAELVGDIGASAPENWVGGFGSGDDHVLVTLHAFSPEALSSYSDRLCAWFAEGDAFREIWRQDGMALMEVQEGQPVPTAKVHFGYTDAITTPTIRGGPETHLPDHQEACDPWLFVLREEARSYDVPEPRALGLNGSFAVFKKVETDVVAFEAFLQANRDMAGTTHQVNAGQAFVKLNTTPGAGSVSMTAPSIDQAPPGYYMVFLVDNQGVPSVAPVVKLEETAGEAAAPRVTQSSQSALGTRAWNAWDGDRTAGSSGRARRHLLAIAALVAGGSRGQPRHRPPAGDAPFRHQHRARPLGLHLEHAV